MKKLFLTVLAAFAFASLQAQIVDVDILPVSDDEKTSELNFTVAENFYFGSLTGLDSPKEMGLKAFKSWELGFDIVNLSYAPAEQHRFDFALNFGTRFFKTRHKNMITNVGGYYVAAPFPVESMSKSKRKSRLDVYELGASLGYEIKVLDDLKIGFDLMGNYNFSAKSVTKYKIGSSKEKLKMKHWKTQKFTPEYRLTIGLPEVKLYVKYAPHSLFQKEYGPKLSYISLGIIL
ncbi:MAG: hypothetical protein J6X91_06345 [Bacteroidales bacterium]|nr:hypothetical protein [Bacteroidales bacterium]MBP5518256.1 hypothetical protein [Bacteroidales bacterium]